MGLAALDIMVRRRIHDERRADVRDRGGDLRAALDVDKSMVDADDIEAGQRLDDFGAELPRRPNDERAAKNGAQTRSLTTYFSLRCVATRREAR